MLKPGGFLGQPAKNLQTLAFIGPHWLVTASCKRVWVNQFQWRSRQRSGQLKRVGTNVSRDAILT